jgi:hypothetical protein
MIALLLTLVTLMYCIKAGLQVAANFREGIDIDGMLILLFSSTLALYLTDFWERLFSLF